MAELEGRVEVEVEELLDGVQLRLPDGAELRARGGRRQARRRIALSAAAVAALAGAVLWAVVPGGGDGGTDVRPAERPDDVVRLMDANELPLHEKWHWRKQGPDGAEDRGIMRIGLSDVGCAPLGTAGAPGHGGRAQVYRGDSNAVARHRLAEFHTSADTDKVVLHLRNVLDNCGMEKRGEGPDAYYTGTGTGPRSHLRVYLTHGEKWLSLVETLDDFRRSS
ncbi:hypothetical protein DEJ49_23925 [Streptomyces venezuelae]|uniref:Uncharacterized protein n=1 Tax=Streptomyces venezuelae TaxID=54571 RepID=A0A5P2CMT4_STRVZ|nr:hypothetical protein [Streptomyces venezuelae]QES43630.1 hypothetical protein DEJ49_23925 [Streptomyces venezuelae]